MARGISDDQHYADIGAAIRTKNETDTLYKPSEMAPAILAIQGGVELNFEVVGGTTQPANPKENTIWVNTSNEITGWIFSAEEPEAPELGMVWFAVGLSSPVEFNALKENTLQVYPALAKQYAIGEWSESPAKIYQGEKWVNLEDTLLPPVDGWNFNKLFFAYTQGDCYFDGNVFVGVCQGEEQGAGIIKSIDFTKYDSVEVYYSLKDKNTAAGGAGYGGVILLVTDYDLNSDSNEIAAKWAELSDHDIGMISIPTNGITGTHKLAAGVCIFSGDNSTNEIRITKIKGVEE